MHEHQPLAEMVARQRFAESAVESRRHPAQAPRHHQRRQMAARLRRLADRLDG